MATRSLTAITFSLLIITSTNSFSIDPKTKRKMPINSFMVCQCKTMGSVLHLITIQQTSTRLPLVHMWKSHNFVTLLTTKCTIMLQCVHLTFSKEKKHALKKYLWLKKKLNSLAGNRTPVSCVTDRDNHHYTTKELHTTCTFLLLVLLMQAMQCWNYPFLTGTAVKGYLNK